MAETKATPARGILHVVRPPEVPEGVGARVRRALPAREVDYRHVDPFLLLDVFSISAGAGFPTHPHRGFEIITYMLEGSFAHSDNLGNQVVGQAGGVQHITAGRGIEHGEMPGQGPGGAARGLQLWINLAQKDKRVPPQYHYIPPGQVPVEQQNGVTLRRLAGEGTAVQLYTPVVYMDVTLAPGAVFQTPVPPEFNGFAYVISGSGEFGSDRTPGQTGELLVLGAGAEFTVHNSGQAPLRFALGAAKPHREPVRWYGPFVD